MTGSSNVLEKTLEMDSKNEQTGSFGLKSSYYQRSLLALEVEVQLMIIPGKYLAGKLQGNLGLN